MNFISKQYRNMGVIFNIDGFVYGPLEFDAGMRFEELIRAHSKGQLLGAAGICFTHRSVGTHSAETREMAGRILQLIPEGKFFVWDEMSVDDALHYGVKAKLGGHPMWLKECQNDERLLGTLVATCVYSAFYCSIAQRPFVIHLPTSTEGENNECHMDVSAHELHRWAKQFGCLDAVTTTMDPEVEKAIIFDITKLKRLREEASDTLESLRPARKHRGVVIADKVFGGKDDDPAPNKPNVRTLEPGSTFDPSTHYDNNYYGINGGGILYPLPEGGWETYRGTAHKWGGNQLLSVIMERLLKGVEKKLLDIGCGSGDFVWRMVQQGWDAYGADISDSGKNVSMVPERIMVGDITKGLAADVANQGVVTALDFWEHIFMRDLDALLDSVHDMLQPGGIHFACICTRGDKEGDQVFNPGVKVTRENAWVLVSGHVNVRTWGWWLKRFVEHGFKPKYKLMNLFQVLREQDPGLRTCQSWSARNVLVVEK